jgi:hypothetical protein
LVLGLLLHLPNCPRRGATRLSQRCPRNRSCTSLLLCLLLLFLLLLLNPVLLRLLLLSPLLSCLLGLQHASVCWTADIQ